MQYKHIRTDEIIDQWAYDHLSIETRKLYLPIYEPSFGTGFENSIEDPDPLLGGLEDDNDTDDFNLSDEDDDFQGFGGGNTGGGGTSDDF